MDGGTDDAGDGTRWMTYAELAAAREITKASATRLAFRKGWPRQTGNDGQARVAVPPAGQEPFPDSIPDSTPDATHGDTDANRDAVFPWVEQLERVATLLRDQVELTARLSAELIEARRLQSVAEREWADTERRLGDLARELEAARVPGPGGLSGAAASSGPDRGGIVAGITGPTLRGVLAEWLARRKAGPCPPVTVPRGQP